ncbi:MAG TPA: hypothetical protein PLS25_08760 [Methanoregulaceae archaeon]|nr:hypothetical protein [Methanoregulaceae archaeon]
MSFILCGTKGKARGSTVRSEEPPFAGIEWNIEAVYNTFIGPPNNWTKEVIDSNILDKLDEREVVDSAWDPDSIMEYEFEEGLILMPEQYKAGIIPAGGKSAMDREWIQHGYPPSIVSEAISLNTPVVLNQQPGKAREFAFSPLETRPYDMQTFGDSDIVMVLFEEINGRRHQLDTDDDSGENRKPHILHTLNEGARYLLSIRMYWNWTTPNDAAVKVWQGVSAPVFPEEVAPGDPSSLSARTYLSPISSGTNRTLTDSRYKPGCPHSTQCRTSRITDHRGG